MSNKGKILLAICVGLVSFAVSVLTYSVIYAGIQIIAKEFGYSLPDLNELIFVIFTAMIQLFTCGKYHGEKNKFDVSSSEFGNRFMNWILNKVFWVIVCIILYISYGN